VKVGDAVSDIKVGDRVGVGAQCHRCLLSNCKRCSTDQEHHCTNEFTTTYDARYPDGSKAYGGFAEYWRGPAAFVFHIPDTMSSETAAPMLCGGLTVFTPLKENGAGPSKRVGIVGMGGLGHFGILFAKAMKADEVIAISRSSSKKSDALSMGVDGFIATGEESDWPTKYADSLDLIISTVSGPGFELEKYLSLLDVKGTLNQVGAPEDPIPSIHAFSLLRKDLKLGGSLVGSRNIAKEMLELAAKAGVSAWVSTRPMSEANEAIVDMANGKARYRYVLTNA
jgi:alcohol dehydrogenase (NADP+)